MAHDALFSPYGHGKLPNLAGVGGGYLMLPIDFTLADGAILWTNPATTPAVRHLRVIRAFYSVTEGFTGGAGSAIGLSSSSALASTKGDILGGAAGDVTATLGTPGIKAGTIGAKLGTTSVVVLAPGDTIRFDRITSQYTAGRGFVFVEVHSLGTSMTSQS